MIDTSQRVNLAACFRDAAGLIQRDGHLIDQVFWVTYTGEMQSSQACFRELNTVVFAHNLVTFHFSN